MPLCVGGIDDELIVHTTHAYCADWSPNGISDSASAAPAPLMPMTSGSFSLSAERTNAMTCVSLRKFSGKSGRMGRSICREVRISFSLGRPSRLMKPAGDAAASVGVIRGSQQSGERNRCLRVLCDATAVTRTTAVALRPVRRRSLFLAMRPVQKSVACAGKLERKLLVYGILVSVQRRR